MFGPWPAPGLPDRGDEDPDATFTAVGLVLSAWETVEFEMARLYSTFADDPDGAAIHRYGDGRIFRDRLAQLHIAADKHFIRRPGQSTEGDFKALADHAEKAADRRNEVAHGIVMRIDTITFFRNAILVRLWHRPHFALVPPLYLLRKHVDGLPEFAYRSRDLRVLSGRMLDLATGVSRYRHLLT